MVGWLVVDKIYAGFNRSAESAALRMAIAGDQELLDEYFAKSVQVDAELSRLESRYVAAADLPKIQDQLIELAKQCNCSLQKSAVSREETRPLPTDGLSGEVSNRRAVAKASGGLQLHVAAIQVSIEGDLENLQKFYRQLRSQNWLFGCEDVQWQRQGDTNQRIRLNIVLSFYRGRLDRESASVAL